MKQVLYTSKLSPSINLDGGKPSVSKAPFTVVQHYSRSRRRGEEAFACSLGGHTLSLAVSAMATVAAIRSMRPRTTREGQGSGCEERRRGEVPKRQESAGIYRVHRKHRLKEFLESIESLKITCAIIS